MTAMVAHAVKPGDQKGPTSRVMVLPGAPLVRKGLYRLLRHPNYAVVAGEIALLPLALIWFGLGTGSIVFVLIHSVLWAVALNTHSGFLSVSNTLRMVGRNYGLRGLSYVGRILIPAAFPSILTGFKIGWAFAWRTLIAAELVFGVSSGSGGLGWFIYENKNELEIPSVFAGLLTVIIIGLLAAFIVPKVIGQVDQAGQVAVALAQLS